MGYKYRKFFSFEGKRYSVYGNTLDEVYAKKAAKLQDLKTGRILVSGAMLVKDWVPMCIDIYKPSLKEETKKEYLQRANNYIVSNLGNFRLKDVTSLQCQKIMSDQAGKSKSHIDKVYQTLRFVFDKAKKNHYIFENPADDLILPKGTQGNGRSLTPEERAAFLKVKDIKESFFLFELMLYCGCRPGEAMKLNRDDMVDVSGTPMLHIRGTKTANSDRHVPAPDAILPRIENTPKHSLLVLTEHGTPYEDQSYKRLTARLRREMNIAMGCKLYRNALVPPLPLAEDFVPYCFRHTYCTDLQKADVDVRVAQKLMGHSSIEITANIYTHVDKSDLVKAAKKIGAYHAGA